MQKTKRIEQLLQQPFDAFHFEYAQHIPFVRYSVAYSKNHIN